MDKFFSKLISLTLLAVFVVGIHAAFIYARPHYKFNLFKTDAETVLKFEIKNQQDLQNKLLKAATERNIPCTEANIVVEPSSEEGRYKVKIEYVESVSYFGYYPKDFKFNLDLYR